MKSSDFRKTYASLTEPTEVTVNGHVIGEWVPGMVARADRIAKDARWQTDTERGFNSRPFTPVPKKGK